MTVDLHVRFEVLRVLLLLGKAFPAFWRNARPSSSG